MNINGRWKQYVSSYSWCPHSTLTWKHAVLHKWTFLLSNTYIHLRILICIPAVLSVYDTLITSYRSVDSVRDIWQIWIRTYTRARWDAARSDSLPTVWSCISLWSRLASLQIDMAPTGWSRSLLWTVFWSHCFSSTERNRNQIKLPNISFIQQPSLNQITNWKVDSNISSAKWCNDYTATITLLQTAIM